MKFQYNIILIFSKTFTDFYNTPALSEHKLNEKCDVINSRLRNSKANKIETEYCYYVEVTSQNLNDEEKKRLKWLLKPSTGILCEESVFNEFSTKDKNHVLLEVGPRLNFSTAFSTNAVSICRSIDLPISRIERSMRYFLSMSETSNSTVEAEIADLLHDKMTEYIYKFPIQSFQIEFTTEPWNEVDILGGGKQVLSEANNELGLAFDDWDLEYYTKFFTNTLQRNPTTVECFDLAQSNSEHSRHWFFKGQLLIDKKENPQSLFSMIMNTQQHSHSNNVIKFCDNSSAIQGFQINSFAPVDSDQPSYFKTKSALQHIIFTAETHNFPTGVAPFSGATTGTGGRIRDVQATGRGAHVIAGTAAYSFGNLNIPGYSLPWEDEAFEYPSNFALPVDIAVEASNGASDYGNKFGEPIISGFARSFGMKLPNGERREWIKPIMYW